MPSFMDSFLLGGASSSALIILSIAVFGTMTLFKMSSFKILLAAMALIAIYAGLDSYKNGALAVGSDMKVIAADVVCIEGTAYKTNKGSLFGSDSLTLLTDGNSSSIKCKKLSEIK